MARSVPLVTALLGAAVVLLGAPASASAPPSVLIVQLDDTRWDGIDRMPELDRFAQGALRFTESFVTSPVCWSSRASLLTGRYARSMDIGPSAVAAASVSISNSSG